MKLRPYLEGSADTNGRIMEYVIHCFHDRTNVLFFY